MVWILVSTKGGTTCNAYCGPPLVHVRIFTLENLAPNRPILIETISFQKNPHFFHLKIMFWMVWILVSTKGGTTCNAYCGPPFGPCQNFHSWKSCSKPSDSNGNYFLSEKLTFFSFKKHVLDGLNFSQYQRGTTCNAYCGHPFGPCQNFHSSKSCSKPSDSNRNYLLSVKLTFFSFKNHVLDGLNFSQYQRGDHMQCILWSPLWSMSEFSLLKILLQTVRF